jgi:glycosyltransferase involved in cell wall biosynthesis
LHHWIAKVPMIEKPRLLRITTVPVSLKVLLQGQLNFFQQHGFEVLAVSADGKEVDSITSTGVPHCVIPMTRQITPLKDLLALVSLVRLIRKFRPDIVHTHTPKAGLLGMLAAWLCAVPVRLHTVAGLPLMEASGLKRQLLVATERICYACATIVYPNSKGLMSYIRNNIGFGSKVRMIAEGSTNGIDTNFFRRTGLLEQQAKTIRNNRGINDHNIVLSFVGRIVRDKGVVEMIQAFKRLRSIMADRKIYLMLVGSFEQELDPLPDEDYRFLHDCPDVILAGYQSDVRPWMMASDIFVFPSYREGFPNVVMQAACLEVPCVVSDINGSNEIVKNEERGLIVAVKDSEALFLAIKKLIVEDSLRKIFSASAKDFVVSHFSQQSVWNALLNEYNRLLKTENRML